MELTINLKLPQVKYLTTSSALKMFSFLLYLYILWAFPSWDKMVASEAFTLENKLEKCFMKKEEINQIYTWRVGLGPSDVAFSQSHMLGFSICKDSVS